MKLFPRLMFGAGLALVQPCLCFSQLQVPYVVTGQIVTNRYQNGVLMESSNSDFRLAKNSKRYAVATIENWPNVQRGNLVVSNYNTTFESRSSILSEGMKSKFPNSSNDLAALGFFVRGAMPVTISGQAAIPQVLSLAILLCEPRLGLTKGTRLDDVYIPQSIKEKVKSQSSEAVAHAFLSEENGVITVRFWGFRGPLLEEPSNQRTNEKYFRVADLRIELKEGVPMGIYFCDNALRRVVGDGGAGVTRSDPSNSVTFEDGRRFVIVPHIEYRFRGILEKESSLDITKISGYLVPHSTVETVHVMDHRFGKAFGYSLRPDQPPAFEDESASYATVAAKRAVVNSKVTVISVKKRVLMAAFILVPVIALVLVVRSRMSGR